MSALPAASTEARRLFRGSKLEALRVISLVKTQKSEFIPNTLLQISRREAQGPRLSALERLPQPA